jgi:hypothetical protein
MDIVRLCRSFGSLPGSAEQRGELSEAEIAVSRILIREQILPRRAQQKMQHTKLEHRREPDPEKTDTKPCLERVALRRPADEQSCGQNDQENEQERRERLGGSWAHQPHQSDVSKKAIGESEDKQRKPDEQRAEEQVAHERSVLVIVKGIRLAWPWCLA